MECREVDLYYKNSITSIRHIYNLTYIQVIYVEKNGDTIYCHFYNHTKFMYQNKTLPHFNNMVL